VLFSVLSAPYKDTRFLWEVFSISRRTALVAASVFLVSDSAARLAMLALLNVSFLLMQIYGKPFRDRFVNYIETASLALLALLALLLSALSPPLTDAAARGLTAFVFVPALLLLLWVAFARMRAVAACLGRVREHMSEWSAADLRALSGLGLGRLVPRAPPSLANRNSSSGGGVHHPSARSSSTASVEMPSLAGEDEGRTQA
jgi:hypothetical protein